METIGIVIASVMGVVAIIYLVLFMIVPMAGRKKAEVDPLVRMHTIELPRMTDGATKIVNHILNFINRTEGTDLRKNRLAHKRICDAALKAEKELQVQESVLIRIPGIAHNDSGPINLELTIYRDLIGR